MMRHFIRCGTGAPNVYMDQVREWLRVKHYSIRTEQVYMDWINALFCFRASGIRETCREGKRKRVRHALTQALDIDLYRNAALRRLAQACRWR